MLKMFSPTATAKDEAAQDSQEYSSARGLRRLTPRRSPRLDESQSQLSCLATRIDSMISAQAAQQDAIRSLEQGVTSILGALATPHADAQHNRSSQQQGSASSSDANMQPTDGGKMKAPWKPPAQLAPSTRTMHRHSSWAWDPQFQSELDNTFEV